MPLWQDAKTHLIECQSWYNLSFAKATSVVLINQEMIVCGTKLNWMGSKKMTSTKMRTPSKLNMLSTHQCEHYKEAHERTCVYSHTKNETQHF
jgi:hypothetical protein